MPNGRHEMVSVDTTDMKRLRDAVRRLNPELGTQLDKGVERSAQIVAKRARALASWSSRIPRSIRVTSKGKSGVIIEIGGSKAPHAMVYESPKRNRIRHPVFGNRAVWVTQKPRRFLRPAMEQKRGEMDRAITSAVDDAISAVGLD